MMACRRLEGARFELAGDDELYPDCLKAIRNPPARIRVIGSLDALVEGLAVIGARRATPYGTSAARRFAGGAARLGIVIVSGGARGCDAAAHEGALDVLGRTVVVLGGGIDRPYPKENLALFQRVIDGGGALISEHPWDEEPRRHYFRARNRIIAGMAAATLIVEAGLPSGTFSTADEALERGKPVLAVPGSISSRTSLGSNALIYQGATPIIDDDTFADQLDAVFGTRPSARNDAQAADTGLGSGADLLLESIRAEPTGLDGLVSVALRCSGDEEALSWLVRTLVDLERRGLVCRQSDGKYGPRL